MTPTTVRSLSALSTLVLSGALWGLGCGARTSDGAAGGIEQAVRVAPGAPAAHRAPVSVTLITQVPVPIAGQPPRHGQQPAVGGGDEGDHADPPGAGGAPGPGSGTNPGNGNDPGKAGDPEPAPAPQTSPPPQGDACFERVVGDPQSCGLMASLVGPAMAECRAAAGHQAVKVTLGEACGDRGGHLGATVRCCTASSLDPDHRITVCQSHVLGDGQACVAPTALIGSATAICQKDKGALADVVMSDCEGGVTQVRFSCCNAI